MELKLKLQLKQDVITGFSYSFAKALLVRLAQLYEKDELWEYYGEEKEERISGQTILAQNLIYYLKEQIPNSDWDNFREIISGFSRKECEQILRDAENFLRTFDPSFKLKITKKYKN